MILTLLLACGDKSADTAAEPTDTAETTPDTTPVQEEVGEIPAIQVQGEVTWTLEFDETAEAKGFTDCAYTRTFSGTQYLDMDYLCPECVVQVQGTSTMTEGLDCYSQISSSATTERTEHWGWSDAAFYRTGVEQGTLGELSEFTAPAEGEEGSVGWASESELSVGGVMTLTATGTLSWWTDADTLLPDPWPASPASYACGWPTNDPGNLTIDYDIGVGKTFPNVRLTDQCGEKLALWDLYGSWLVMDTSQPDCGPCRSMAAEAEAFVEAMAAEGYDVKVVSFLGNGLSDPYGTPDADTHTAWVEDYGLTDPVLYDRGFAYALFPTFVEEYSGESFGYPTWIVVDPDMNLVHGNVGFGSWDDVGDIIKAN
jgi:thiol-disulfide isomerase/thioredoxin